jgi:uncharacterized protein (UPF0276 family)
MKIAINYSNALLTLLSEDPYLAFDYIKAPTRPFPDCWEQFGTLDIGYQPLPHLAQIGVIFLGHPEPKQCFDVRTVAKVLQCTNPPYLSTHLEARTEFFSEISEYQHQNHPEVKRVLREHFLRAVKTVKEQLKIPLVVENFPYYTWWRHFKWGSEPEFISEICKQGDCGLLLDIAHARCSAWHMKRDLVEYIMALPLDCLREIHLGGVRQRGVEGLRDTHTTLTEEDYQLTEFLITRTNPDIITIEYGGMPDQILNIEHNYEPIQRNDPGELKEIISRVQALVRVRSR